MDTLKIPEQFKGSWENALILTYGADIPFFENALRRELSAHCRNRVILVDGQQYLDACRTYARGGFLRYLNQRYVTEGIFGVRAAHGKVILLTNSERGRLLVGSGNLNWQGYASGGELFTRYEYTQDNTETLPAFLAIHELVEALIARGFVKGTAIQRVRYLWEHTPWLFGTSQRAWHPVRHNLSQSFITQLQEFIGKAPVQELWILVPFYDKQTTALRKLLSTFQPEQTTLLVQPGATSVDPATLQEVVNRVSGQCRVCQVRKDDNSTYIHAKLYLFKLADQAICLQGSPNLSNAAMLLTPPRANIEVANLLTGARDAFDHLLDALDIQPVLHIDTLDLRYQSSNPLSDEDEKPWYLTGGELVEDCLRLRYRGALPDLEEPSLSIGSQEFELGILRTDAVSITLQVPAQARGQLTHPLPVTLCWHEGETPMQSNPVFVCNAAALDAVLEVTDSQKTLPGIGDLNLEDEELERLLGELDAALVYDTQSLWQLAGRSSAPVDEDDSDAEHIAYEDIDYDALRRHPKIQQYIHPHTGGPHRQRTRLQIILNAITNHFQGLMDTTPGKAASAVADAIKDLAAEAEDEGDEIEDSERPNVRKRYAKRLARIFKGFIRRYLHGLRSPNFLELAGYEVIAQNYIIFSHILSRLLTKDWIESDHIQKTFLKVWYFFWGKEGNPGYFAGLSSEQRTQVRQWMREEYAIATLLAALYHISRTTHEKAKHKFRFEVRDFWRSWLSISAIEITKDILEETWYLVADWNPYDPPAPSAIVAELQTLAEFETRQHFLKVIEDDYQYPPLSCRFDTVHISHGGRRSYPTDCLMIDVPNALANAASAFEILERWMQAEKLDYYRIQHSSSDRLVFYNAHKKKGCYSAGRVSQDFRDFKIELRPWESTLNVIAATAQQLDAELRIDVEESVSCSV